ncbi:MAG: primosomal protein N', partial [Chromatiales bacterium]
MNARLILRVAVPVPLYTLLDYLPPEGMPAERLQPGCRIEVTIARRSVTGVIWDVCEQTSIDLSKLKRADAVIDPKPLLGGLDRELLAWCAGYYRHPIGEVVQACLPARLRQGLLQATRKLPAWRLLNRTVSPDDFQRAPVQLRIIRQLLESETPVLASQLQASDRAIRGGLRRLVEKGVIEEIEITPENRPGDVLPRPELTQEQQSAVNAMLESSGFAPMLLDGITGSGKTEVYLAIAEVMIRAGHQVL